MFLKNHWNVRFLFFISSIYSGIFVPKIIITNKTNILFSNITSLEKDAYKDNINWLDHSKLWGKVTTRHETAVSPTPNTHSLFSRYTLMRPVSLTKELIRSQMRCLIFLGILCWSLNCHSLSSSQTACDQKVAYRFFTKPGLAVCVCCSDRVLQVFS